MLPDCGIREQAARCEMDMDADREEAASHFLGTSTLIIFSDSW